MFLFYIDNNGGRGTPPHEVLNLFNILLFMIVKGEFDLASLNWFFFFFFQKVEFLKIK